MTVSKQNNLVAASREQCCGCWACHAICPCGAIDMAEDAEGFIYAVKNEACIHCGLCARVCPIQPNGGQESE